MVLGQESQFDGEDCSSLCVWNRVRRGGWGVVGGGPALFFTHPSTRNRCSTAPLLNPHEISLLPRFILESGKVLHTYIFCSLDFFSNYGCLMVQAPLGAMHLHGGEKISVCLSVKKKKKFRTDWRTKKCPSVCPSKKKKNSGQTAGRKNVRLSVRKSFFFFDGQTDGRKNVSLLKQSACLSSPLQKKVSPWNRQQARHPFEISRHEEFPAFLVIPSSFNLEHFNPGLIMCRPTRCCINAPEGTRSGWRTWLHCGRPERCVEWCNRSTLWPVLIKYDPNMSKQGISCSHHHATRRRVNPTHDIHRAKPSPWDL